MPLRTSVFVLELSAALVSFSAVYKEMLIWISQVEDNAVAVALIAIQVLDLLSL